jgi:hypothetical protein
VAAATKLRREEIFIEMYEGERQERRGFLGWIEEGR